MATTKRNKKPTHKVETVSQNEGTKQAAGEVLRVLPNEYTYLSKEQLKLISTLPNAFVDIHHLGTAKQLRVIEREQVLHSHKLIEISKAVGKYGVHEPQPYFSVKLGEDGLKLKVGL